MGEEMMDLATCRCIDFPGVGVIDLEGPQLLEKEYEVAVERRSNEPTIMETIASVSKALKEYERADGFALAATIDAEDGVLEAPTVHVEPTADASVPPQVDGGREASPFLVGGCRRNSSPCPGAWHGGAHCRRRGNIAAPSNCR
jgi:hypothetical protein